MKFTILGIGTPELNIKNPKGGSSAVFSVGKDILLFDCGRWVTLRLVQAGFHPNQITHFLFTHIFHFDHTCDYYDFLMSVRPEKLNIYGPMGTKEYTEKLLELNFKFGEGRTKSVIEWVKNHAMEIEKDTTIMVDGGKVTATNIDQHTNWPPNIAYKIEDEKSSAVIAWDIHPIHPRKPGELLGFNDCYTSRKELMELIEGVDVLLADALGIHTSPEGIGIAAEGAKVKKIVITHYSEPSPQELIMSKEKRDPMRPIPIELSLLKERIEKVFSGEVIMGRDLMVFEI